MVCQFIVAVAVAVAVAFGVCELWMGRRLTEGVPVNVGSTSHAKPAGKDRK
jgi:hypothetical protein